MRPATDTPACLPSQSGPRGRVLAGAVLLLPLLTAGLEVTHPTWTDDAVFQAVAPVVSWWIALHLLLIVLFAGLAVVLDRELATATAADREWDALVPLTRLLLCLFVLCSTLFLAVDGLGTGLWVQASAGLDAAQQGTAQQVLATVWASALLTILADAAGVTWALSLLGCAAALYPQARQPWPGVLLVGVILLLGVATVLPAPTAAAAVLAGRIAALAAGAVLVFQGGGRLVPCAWLLLAAVLPQHVGGEAMLGMLCLFGALAGRTLERRRSAAPARVP